MEVKIGSIGNEPSCNFCQRGEMNFFRTGLIYPYKNVLVFKGSIGSGLSASICEECLEELYEKGKSEFENLNIPLEDENCPID